MFFPREHGAYAELALPLVTGLALGDFGAAPLLFALTAAIIFIVHEPILVVAGARGVRLQREASGEAWRTIVVLALLGAVAATWGLAVTSTTARFGALIPVALGCLLVPLIFTRSEKSLFGELLVAVVLAATMIPVALAGGVETRVATSACAVWVIVFSLETLAVHTVKVRAKGRGRQRWPLVATPFLGLLALGAAHLSWRAGLPGAVILAAIPPILISAVVSLLPVHPRHLRSVGWLLTVASLITLVILVVGLR